MRNVYFDEIKDDLYVKLFYLDNMIDDILANEEISDADYERLEKLENERRMLVNALDDLRD